MLQRTRRAQLVLADRAFHLQDTLQKLGLKADRHLWSALIQCAGQSGQLTRAFKLLDDMMVSGIKPDSHTFVILIDSCVMVRSFPPVATTLRELSPPTAPPNVDSLKPLRTPCPSCIYYIDQPINKCYRGVL
jgi:pentatricopeptide repeat protein